jgi:DNA invertase Pin-like site-specific DNA recombinase
MQTAIYVRAADAPEQVDERRIHLEDTISSRGWTIAGTYVDQIVGPLKNRNKLPGLSDLLNAASRNKVDVVMVWTVSHLATSLDTLLDVLADLERFGVMLVVHDRADDVETGGLLATADILVAARRAYRREGIIAGQLKAKACGTRFGRPPVPPNRLEKVRAALEAGQGVRQAARSTGISAAKVSRIRAEMVGAQLMG